MKLYDTLTRTERELTPRDGKVFRFYCCGPTVYGPAHIGNFRTFVLQDVFRRTLELSGIKTRHVRNLTDVDDKTIRDSQAQGQSLEAFTARWRDRFHEDCARLNLLDPHQEPSAIAHVPQQIALIESLIDKGHAYASEDGSVYYRVASFEEYGKLSHLDQREIRHGASGAIDDDEYEKDAVADFVLWKSRKPEDGDNFWESPWGEGRPGWHLECSAMCREYLGDSFDLHSGGVDLIFPHHENEIAQSEAATGCTMADHWFHLTHLLVDGGKMSKSAGNFYTLEKIEAAGFSGAEVRYVLISASYRQPLNFVARNENGAETFPSLAGAHQALERLARFDSALSQQGQVDDSTGYDQLIGLDEENAFRPAFEALLNDLNTPDALGRLFSAVKATDPESLSPEAAAREQRGFRKVIEALGLHWPEASESVEIPAEISDLAVKRSAAKAEKDWAAADAIRDQLHELGWEIKDSRDGYELCPKS